MCIKGQYQKQWKDKPQDGKKGFANHMKIKHPENVKNCSSIQIYKEPNLKMSKGSEETFFQRHTKVKKHIKRCSTSLVLREMQTKIT